MNPLTINSNMVMGQLTINLSLNAVVANGGGGESSGSSVNIFSRQFNLVIGLNIITHNLGSAPTFVSFYQEGQGALQLQWDYEGVNPLQQINVYCAEVFNNVLVNIL